MIVELPNLKMLRLFRCSDEWDHVLEEVAKKAAGIVEVHLEKLQDQGGRNIMLQQLGGVNAIEFYKLCKVHQVM
ncbi:uncharacterized protein A4U43_C01F25480 [Asparagus officinalis]|uniref:Uncharacterized protein n=1 Tax=Asparagus officinalis TaxID=4686 RepID=A0A5P1FS29_ASPOF|nr:uncharacterized protein A4U43_C01F25480 [Asparagus officinalis]